MSQKETSELVLWEDTPEYQRLAVRAEDRLNTIQRILGSGGFRGLLKAPRFETDDLPDVYMHSGCRFRPGVSLESALKIARLQGASGRWNLGALERFAQNPTTSIIFRVGMFCLGFSWDPQHRGFWHEVQNGDADPRRVYDDQRAIKHPRFLETRRVEREELTRLEALWGSQRQCLEKTAEMHFGDDWSKMNPYYSWWVLVDGKGRVCLRNRVPADLDFLPPNFLDGKDVGSLGRDIGIEMVRVNLGQKGFRIRAEQIKLDSGFFVHLEAVGPNETQIVTEAIWPSVMTDSMYFAAARLFAKQAVA